MFDHVKKTMMTTALTVVSVGLLSTTAIAGNPYAPYKGTTLVVNFPSHPHYDAVEKVLPKFTEETGIKVEVDKLQYMAMRQKQTLELTKPKGDYDLITFVVFSKADYVPARQIEALAPFFMNPKLADPDYDPEDLVSGYVQNIGVAGGKKGYLPGPTGALYGIPFGAETSVLGYRKDIFEKHHLKVPETYDELLDLVCKIPELEPGMAGLTSRGASGHQLSHAFLLHLAPLGGRFYDDKWNPIVNNEAGVKAGEALQKILKCGPEGGTSFGFAEMKNVFLQGKAAMYLDSTSAAAEFQDPEKSKVVGKVGWALHPKGVRRGSQTGGFGIAIPSNAQHKEAAFLLMQWLTSKRIDKLIALEGGSPCRFSTLMDPEVNAKYPHMKIFAEALKYADPDWRPIIPTWGEVNNELGTTLSEAMTGKRTVKDALDQVAKRARAIQEKAGYYTWK